MHRLGRDHRLRKAGIVGRDVAPAEKGEPLGFDHAFDDRLAIDALGPIARHEHMADAVVAGLGQRDAQRRAGLAQEFMRDLHEDTSAVAGERVGSGGAAMGQVFEDLQAVLDDLAARPAFEIGDETDAASIVLVLRIVESLRGRRRRPRLKRRNPFLATQCHRHLKPCLGRPPPALLQAEDVDWLKAEDASRLLWRCGRGSLFATSPTPLRRARDKGQQACPICPQNDRFTRPAQEGFTVRGRRSRQRFTACWRSFDLT